jgi:hypothetical protein
MHLLIPSGAYGDPHWKALDEMQKELSIAAHDKDGETSCEEAGIA